MMYAKRKFDPKNPNKDGYGFGIFTAIGISAGTAMMAGAAVMAVGSVLGIKEAAPIGGLMMAGGGIGAGIAGLGLGGAAATASGTLGTLSAGASLVGGALQGVGILTGNNKMAGIGGLINGAGMLGTSMDAAGMFNGGGASQTVNGMTTQIDGTTSAMSLNPGQQAMFDNARPFNNTGVTSINAPVTTPSGATPPPVGGNAVDSFMSRYGKLLEMGGNAAKSMNENKTINDYMAQQQRQFGQTLAEQQRQHTAVAIPSVGVSAAPIPQVARPISRNNPLGILAAG